MSSNSPSRPLRAFVVLMLAGAGLVGCGGPKRVVTGDELRAVRGERIASAGVQRQVVLQRLAARVTNARKNTLDVLLLSGGGQHGAFGAGFLMGWSEREDDPMPEFDVVTGISTGALLSPFAFLGTDEALQEVATLYRNPQVIAPERDLFGALFRRTGGLFTTDELTQTLSYVYDADLVARLTEDGFRHGRQLFIGSTDLDLGRRHVWDLMTDIDTSAAGVERFERILLASTAIPGVFPPVEIDGRYHTDGGVAAPLLSADLRFMEDFGSLLRARGVQSEVRIRLWAIVNLFLSAPPVPVDAGSFLAVSNRATALMMWLNQQETLTRLWETARAVTSNVEGVRMEIQVAAIPDSWALEPGAGELFDARYMNRLLDYGYERALGPKPWDVLPVGPF